jgi:hypothetical protein
MSLLNRRFYAPWAFAVLGLLLTSARSRGEDPKAKDAPAKPAEAGPRESGFGLDALLDAIQRQREAAARRQVAENLRQLALEMRQHRQFLLPAQQGTPLPQQPVNPLWMAQILPYVEQDNIYNSPAIKSYLCPSATLTGNRFGARIEPVTPVLASHLALPKDQGQMIGEIEKGKAADKAGLKQHDILVKLNGKDAPRDADAFAKLLADIKPEKAVDAVVLREGKRIDIKGLSLPEAALGLRPDTNYLYGLGDGSVYRIPPNPQLHKWLTDGTSNTLMFSEDWGTRPAAPEGLNVWSKGDPILGTTFRSKDRFTTRQQEGSLVLTVVGTVKDGKPAVSTISVREGNEEKKYDTLDKVPAEYRDKVARLIELSAK